MARAPRCGGGVRRDCAVDGRGVGLHGVHDRDPFTERREERGVEQCVRRVQGLPDPGRAPRVQAPVRAQADRCGHRAVHQRHSGDVGEDL